LPRGGIGDPGIDNKGLSLPKKNPRWGRREAGRRGLGKEEEVGTILPKSLFPAVAYPISANAKV